MSILDNNTIDGIALNNDGNGIKLFISDHLDWEKEYEHLIALQDKINSYIAFCEEQQYNEIYKDKIIEYAVFEIHFKFEPTETAMRFLDQVQIQLNEMGILIECHLPKI